MVFLAGALGVLGVFTYYYVKFDRIVERRLRNPLLAHAAVIYARPKSIQVGDQITPQEIAEQLRRAGYSDAAKGNDSDMGTYWLLSSGIEIKPGPDSYHNQDGAVIRVSGQRVERIIGTGGSQGRALTSYELEPLLVTALEGAQRSKRQLVRYQEIPKVLVDAVLAIEDRRFFQHGGVNYLRLMQAAWVDLREGRHGQGGSTITMQVSRAFFLTREKTIKRKAAEILIAILLERKLSKERIFELYANQVDLGQRGSFTISGFAEAARAYFNKDLQSLTLPEAALLAGMVQRPSYLNPYRHPERALERRNLVLEAMVDTGAINRPECDRAEAAPLKLAPLNVEASDAPYFVDLVKDNLAARYGEHELNENAYRIYSTLDTDLQQAAAEAVQLGLQQIDEQIARRRTRRVKVGKKVEVEHLPGPQAQIALVALDPHTGEVLALVGGRNYGMSQLNHAVARRPTGSVFKPFVYATAINTAVSGELNVVTPASLIDDSPGTYFFEDKVYEPRNYKEEYHGPVTARYALAHSLNNATVRLAELVGYDNVALLARAAGLKSVQPTPAMALGAYDATPLEVAGAYTIFANAGVRVSPVLVRSVVNGKGDVVATFRADTAPVLDPRVAYVITSMMESVIDNGTAVRVRAMGFSAPAAGKTGTSHDGWFAGYTTNLLCVVWVGFDDYSDLKLSGSTTAAPVWTEFMKRALQLPGYRQVSEFPQPEGVVDVQLDKVTNRLATPACPDDYTVAFIAGTEPTDTCDHPAAQRGILSRILGLAGDPQPPPVIGAAPSHDGQGAGTETSSAPAVSKKRKGFFGRIVGIFKDDKPAPSPPPAPPEAPKAEAPERPH
jgi:penicillin-binding protein 1B